MEKSAPSRDAPLKRIVIVGGGTTGWLTAALLSRAIPQQCEIQLIESANIGTIGVGEATIPQLLHLNEFLDVDEAEMLSYTRGTFKLGLQLVNFGRLGDSYLHGFGDIGLKLGLLPFHHYWLRAQRTPGALPLWAYSLNAEAASHNRFSRPMEIPANPLTSGVRYAYQFDAARYVGYLRQKIPQGRVVRTEGKVVDVTLRGIDGFIDAVTLDSGETVKGDFFLDCTGFRGVLIEGALKTGYENWQRWLPCDRALAVPSARTGLMRPYTQAIAHTAGWQWRIALQHRTGNGHVYCSGFISEDEAAAQLLANLEGEPLKDPYVLRFVSGMRRKTWNRNCLALGLAAGFMEPLESTTIHLVQSGVARFLDMLPNKHCDAVLVDTYNRQTRDEYEQVRDFLVLHYKATQRDDSPFWRQCSAMEVPPALRDRIELFRRTGLIFRKSDELFTEGSWLQVLLGQHVEPEHYNPIADDLAELKLQRFLEDVRSLVLQAVSCMPTHDEYVAQLCGVGASQDIA